MLGNSLNTFMTFIPFLWFELGFLPRCSLFSLGFRTLPYRVLFLCLVVNSCLHHALFVPSLHQYRMYLVVPGEREGNFAVTRVSEVTENP